MATKGHIAAGKEKAIARLGEAMDELSNLVGVEPITIEKRYRDPDYNQMDQLTRLAEWSEELVAAVRSALDTLESHHIEMNTLRQAAEVSNVTIADLQAEVAVLQEQLNASDEPSADEQLPGNTVQSEELTVELDETSPVPPLPEITDEQVLREFDPVQNTEPPTKSTRKK